MILKAYQEESGLMQVNADNKASIMRVLSKSRDRRTEAELLAVAAFLERRNHFFQKCTAEQRLELCRVSELICIYGRNTLFKQGQIGQAFYVILSGTVDVYVNSVDATDSNALKTGADGILVNTLVSGASFGERALDSATNCRTGSVLTCEGLTELLVISREDYHSLVSIMLQEEMAEKCALLRTTLLFKDVSFPTLRELAKYMEAKMYHIDEFLTIAGKKALDIIIIKEGECTVEMELESYCNIEASATTSYAGSVPMTPVRLHGVDDDNHSEISDASDRKRLRGKLRNTTSALMGQTAKSGGTSKAKKSKKSEYRQQVAYNYERKREVYNLGRVGPGAVLSTDISQTKSINADAYHRETIQATTIVSAFVIAKNDFFHHLSADVRSCVSDLVRDYRPPYLSAMWDAGPKPMGEDEWRMERAWKNFAVDVRSGKKHANILKNHKRSLAYSLSDSVGNKTGIILHKSGLSGGPSTHTAASDGLSDYRRDTSTAAYRHAKAMVALTKHELLQRQRTVQRRLGEEQAERDKEEMRRFTPLTNKEVEEAQQKAKRAARMGAGSATADDNVPSLSSAKGKTIILSDTKGVSGSCKLPFSLIHIHRERVKHRAGTGPRRLVKCYFRLCGMNATCAEAINGAEALMLNAFITMLGSDVDRTQEIYLNWNNFLGYESMPLHQTDHFISKCCLL